MVIWIQTAWFCKHTQGHGVVRVWTSSSSRTKRRAAPACEIQNVRRGSGVAVGPHPQRHIAFIPWGFVCNVSLINVENLKTNGCRRPITEFLCTPGWPTIFTIVAGCAEQASAVRSCLPNQDSLPHSAFVARWKRQPMVSRHHNHTEHHQLLSTMCLAFRCP